MALKVAISLVVSHDQDDIGFYTIQLLSSAPNNYQKKRSKVAVFFIIYSFIYLKSVDLLSS